MTSKTTDALWAVFKPRRVDNKKSGGEYQRLYEAHVRPKLGARRVDKITFADIEDLHHALRFTPYQANRVLALLRVMFKYATALRWIDFNPASEVQMFPEKKRRRHMRPTEAQDIAFQILIREAGNPASCLFLWLIIFTGARSGEISSACWSDLKDNVLTLKNHKTADSSGTDRIIVLPKAAMDKLEYLAPVEHRHPNGKIISINRPEVLWQRYIRKEAGCPDLRIHDLRHTFGTYALEKGYSLGQIGESLSHSSHQTTKIYAELTDRSRQTIARDVSLGILADMKMVEVEEELTGRRLEVAIQQREHGLAAYAAFTRSRQRISNEKGQPKDPAPPVLDRASGRSHS